VFCEEEKCRVNELLSKDDLSDDSVINCWSDPGARKSTIAPIAKNIVGVDKGNANQDVFSSPTLRLSKQNRTTSTNTTKAKAVSAITQIASSSSKRKPHLYSSTSQETIAKCPKISHDRHIAATNAQSSVQQDATQTLSSFQQVANSAGPKSTTNLYLKSSRKLGMTTVMLKHKQTLITSFTVHKSEASSHLQPDLYRAAVAATKAPPLVHLQPVLNHEAVNTIYDTTSENGGSSRLSAIP
jgi:hypothetical protein